MSKGNTLKYPINMTPEVVTYWYDRFLEFSKQNPDEFVGLTFADYLGTQVLANMMRIFEGQPAPMVGEEPEEVTDES